MEEDLKAEVMVEDCLIVPVEEKQVEQSVDDGRIGLAKRALLRKRNPIVLLETIVLIIGARQRC